MQVIVLTLVDLVQLAGQVYFWIVVARAFSSWLNPDPYNPVVRFLYQATEPALAPIRRFIPSLGGLDLSPIVLIFAVQLATRFVARLLTQLAYGM